MAKSKYAPALFEVIQKGQDAAPSGQLSLPKWWRRAKPEVSEAFHGTGVEPAPVADPPPHDAATAVPDEPMDTGPGSGSLPVDPVELSRLPAAPPEPVVPRLAQPAVHVPEPVLRDEELDAPPRLLRLRGGRVELSMTPVNASVAVSLLLLTLVVAYQMGHRIGGMESPRPGVPVAAVQAQDEIEAALARRPNESVLGVAPAGAAGVPAPTAAEPQAPRTGLASVQPPRVAAPATPQPPTSPPIPEPGRRVAGRTYVELENFGADDKASAEFAQKWFAERKLPTQLEKTARGWRLVSVEGFQGPDDQNCLHYIENVKSLGRELNRDMVRAGVQNYLFRSPGRFTER